jgi:P4 family phage/plasmid primase-like protien
MLRAMKRKRRNRAFWEEVIAMIERGDASFEIELVGARFAPATSTSSCATSSGTAIGQAGVSAGIHDVDARRERGLYEPHPTLKSLKWAGNVTYMTPDAGNANNPSVAIATAINARILSELGADVRLVRIPFHEDELLGPEDQGPDDFIRRHGQQAFFEAVLAAVPALPHRRVHHHVGDVHELLRDLPFVAGLVAGGPEEIALTADAARRRGCKTLSAKVLRHACDMFQRAVAVKHEESTNTKRLARGDDVELAEALLGELASDPKMLVHAEGNLHRYDEGSRLWISQSDLSLRAKVTEFPSRFVVGLGDRKSALQISDRKCSGVVGMIAPVLMRTRGDDTSNYFVSAPFGAAFQDTFVRVEGGKTVTPTVTIETLRREHAQRAKYDVPYVPGATPQRYIALLAQAFKGDPDALAKIEIIRQFHGLTILGRAPLYQRALIFIGDGNEGKSTIAKIIASTMPAETVVSVSPQQMTHPYSRARMAGKLLNVVNEMPEAEIMASEAVKAIIDGSAIEARSPYEVPFDLCSRAGTLLIGNALPRTRDTTYGFRRRWIVFEFLNRVEGVDRFIAETILANERAEILSWAVDGAIELLKHDNYAIPESCEASLDKWMGESDTVAEFCEACLQMLPLDTAASERALSPPIYDAYKWWCKDDSHGSPMTSKRFLARLSKWYRAKQKLAPRTPIAIHTGAGEHYPVRLREHRGDSAHPAHVEKAKGNDFVLPSEWEDQPN